MMFSCNTNTLSILGVCLIQYSCSRLIIDDQPMEMLDPTRQFDSTMSRRLGVVWLYGGALATRDDSGCSNERMMRDPLYMVMVKRRKCWACC